MENNKAYLQRIHWVFLTCAVYALLIIFIDPWARETFETGLTYYIILDVLRQLVFFVGLYVVTLKLKEVGIAFGVAMLLYTADRLTGMGFELTQRLIFFILTPLPLLVFFALQTGWNKKLVLYYFFILLISEGFAASYFTPNGMNSIARALSREPSNFFQVLSVFCTITAFQTFRVIIICEMINYIKGKTYTKRSTLINLGNDYNKLNSIIAFWSSKVALYMVIIGGAAGLNFILEMINREHYFTQVNEDVPRFYLYIGGISVLSFICMALFAVWYVRKLIIETFINFSISSKLVYWLCVLPIIGIFAFAIAQADSTRQKKHSDKLNTMGLFAGSSTAFITGLFFFILFVRFIIRIVDGDPTYIISLGLSLLLLLWVMTSKTGYYVSLVLAGLALLAVTIASFIVSSGSIQGELALFFGLLLLNVVQLIFLYPVYHFEEFEYIPAEDPDAPKVPETLFPQT